MAVIEADSSTPYSLLSDDIEPISSKSEATIEDSPFTKLKNWQWWVLVGINIFFVIAGQSAAVLLGRFYYDEGGNSTWLATLVQTIAFPILFVPLFLLSSSEKSSTSSTSPPITTLLLIYLFLGLLIASDNMLYSMGLLYLSASTYSLICATQLAFNAIFSYFINSQKFTILILASVVLLSLSASLIAVDKDSGESSGVSTEKYIVGFIFTLGASAVYSLLLSLMQLCFEKVIQKETFSVVLNMQIYTSLVASCVSLMALFVSGEWGTLHGEMEGFGTGRASYVMTLSGTAVAWQVCSVGVVGLIFLTTSLFSNVISTVALAVSPVAAVVIFGDQMSVVKVIAMALAILGFGSYSYQNYLDDSKARTQVSVGEIDNDSTC